MKTIKKYIPWQIKFIGKLVISLFGLTVFLQKNKVFRHGDDDVEVHFKVFKEHVNYVASRIPQDFTLLELGPGYSVATAYFAHAMGASHTYLVDRDDFIDIGIEERAKQFMLDMGVNDAPRYTYLSNGLESLKEISDGSVDVVFSNAVLEHVKKTELLPLLKETCRILKSEGVSVHTIDFKDHLGGSVHHLCFSERFWASDLIYRSGFYTNRLRISDMLRLFEEAGFTYSIVERSFLEHVPQIGSYSHDDLATASCKVCLYKK